MNIAGFFKIFGLVLAGFVGLFAVIIGYLFATGGFKPPYIPSEAIAFEYDEYIIDEDTEIFIYPFPEDATELEVELRVVTGSSIISVPETTKMGEPILVEVLKNELEQNYGGVAFIRASQGGLLISETKILVDVPVESFTIKSSNTGNLYVGNTFTASTENLSPANSLNPSNVNFSMPDKVVRYYSSHPSIATVDELTGQVETLSEGVFTIEARVIKTYNLVDLQPNPLDFEYEEDYWVEMDLISVVATREFVVSSIAVAGIETNDNQEDPLYELYLHDTYTFTPSQFGLQLLPQPDSSFTPAQLSYKLNDLQILVSNEEVLEVIQLDEPLRYQIRVLDYETWQINQTRITFVYEDEFNRFEGTIHFEILRNDIVNIEIEKNTPSAIEVLLKDPNPETFDLEENTIITAENEEQVPTYTKLIYKVDLTQARNDLNELIIDIDTVTGYVLDNIITPLNRGTTRLKAIVVQTDIYKQPILDEFGNYIVMYEMPEYVSVNVLEQLTEIVPVKFKKPKHTQIVVGETFLIEASNLTPQQMQDYSEDKIRFVVSDEDILELISVEQVGDTITATYLSLQTGTLNVFITNVISKMFLDYVELEIVSGSPSLDPIEYLFDLNKTLEVTPAPTPENPDPAPIISMIRGTEAFLTFDPNSYGAFVDAYRYGKLVFESTNPNMIQIYGTIDDQNNIIVKLDAVGFDLNPDNSFSMIRIRLSDSPPNIFLLNEKVHVDLGAVNGIHLSVNSQTIEAIPEVSGTQWLTPLGEGLIPTVTFSNPDEPAITGVQFISGDTSILEIDELNIDENGIPGFVFKKAGTVILTVKSLDEHAKPTDIAHPELGAYAFVVLNVTAPNVVTDFRYTNSVDASVDDFTKMLAGEEIDLLAKEVLVEAQYKARIHIERDNGVDYTPMAQFELIGAAGAATLTETAENTTLGIPRKLVLKTNEIGVSVEVQIRVFTDFGYETYYTVNIIPNISSTITYKGGSSPEEIYPPTEGQTQIRLLEVQDSVRRVLITKRDGSQINNLQFQLSNYNSATISQYETGVIIAYETAVQREVEIRIFIEFASGINFETFYSIIIMPNIDVQLDYSNSVVYGQFIYEEIDYSPTYDLILNNKIAAYTIEPSGTDITYVLGYVLLDPNPNVSISQVGVLTIGEITEDQYIAIRIYTNYDYTETYRIKIKA